MPREMRRARRAEKKRMRDERLTVAVVGAGRLGTALALALADTNYKILAVVTRRTRSAREAARLLRTTRALNLSQLDQLPAVDLLLITTPDDQIAAVAARLAEVLEKMPTRRRRIALHASGALSSDALAMLRAKNFAVGSLHPLVAVSDGLTGAANLRRAFYCVEGDAPAIKLARRIVRDLGAQSFSIKTRDKALYHAAAVMSSGHVVALFDLAAGMLALCGLTPARARQVLLPLLRSTLDNLASRKPARALTGTFARADLTTVRRHLDALRRSGARDALATYALLGERSLRLAKEAGANAEALVEIARVLAEASDVTSPPRER